MTYSDIESVWYVLPPTVIISTTLEGDMTTHCLVIAFLLIIRYVNLHDLVTLISDRGLWSYMSDDVVNLFTKFEDATPIYSWVMNNDISHNTILTMCLQPPSRRCITWPMRKGQISPYLKSLTPLCIQCETFTVLHSRQIQLSAKIVYGPVACAKSLEIGGQNYYIFGIHHPSHLFTVQLLWRHAWRLRAVCRWACPVARWCNR